MQNPDLLIILSRMYASLQLTDGPNTVPHPDLVPYPDPNGLIRKEKDRKGVSVEVIAFLSGDEDSFSSPKEFLMLFL